MFWSDVRRSIFQLLKIAFGKHFLSLYFCLAGYTVAMTYGLYLLGYWNLSLLKYSIFGMLFIGLTSSFKIISQKEKTLFLKELVVNSIKWTVIVQFITGKYTFNFFVEFITLFILFIMGCMIAVAERDKDKKIVVKFCNAVIYFYVFIAIAFSFYQAILDFNNLMTFSTLKVVLLPIIMMILYLPFFYLFALYCLYEGIFIKAKIFIGDDKKLTRYFIFRIVLLYGFSMKKLEMLQSSNYVTASFSSKESINEFLMKQKS